MRWALVKASQRGLIAAPLSRIDPYSTVEPPVKVILAQCCLLHIESPADCSADSWSGIHRCIGAIFQAPIPLVAASLAVGALTEPMCRPYLGQSSAL